MSQDYGLQGQIALVTGAGRRIGRTIALTLARAGSSVVVNYNESKREAEQTAREIASLGVESVAMRADVAKAAEVRAMFAAVKKRFGRLDILVNNAGIFFPCTWDKLTEKDWDRILGVNLKGPFFLCKHAVPFMRQRGGGCIVNIGSVHGLGGAGNLFDYSVSKGGLLTMTSQLGHLRSV